MDLWTQTQDTERSPGHTGAASGLSNGESRSEEKPSWASGVATSGLALVLKCLRRIYALFLISQITCPTSA